MPKAIASPFDPMDQALADIAAGKLVVVTDDERRENEGDLVMAAAKVTPEAVNMMIRHARGLICAPLTEHQLKKLGLNLMVQHNRESHGTQFTVSVDAAEGVTTGISAYDRAATIKILADPAARPEQLVQPGHIFPLRARPGGVLERAGHTEAAVDLASLAGLHPSGVVCEILNEDGSCARLPELIKFKKRFGLTLVSIADLIEYRLRREKLVECVHREPLATEYGDFELRVFRQLPDGRCHFALTMGGLNEKPILARVHSENLLSDVFQLKSGKSRGSLVRALQSIAREKRGVMLYLTQPLGGVILPEPPLEKAGGKHHAPETSALRHYGIGAQILRALGLKKIRLLSGSAQKPVALEGYGLEIVEQIML